MAEPAFQAKPPHSRQCAAVVGLAQKRHIVPIGGQCCCQVAELAWEIQVEKQNSHNAPRSVASRHALLQAVVAWALELGLPLALQAHQKGDISLAIEHYQRALDHRVADPVLYQNYGALLRSEGQEKEAATVYQQGLELFPHHPGILANRANLLRSSHPASSLADQLLALRLLLIQGPEAKGLLGAWLTTVAQLRDLQLTQWALALARDGLAWLGAEPQLLLHILLTLEALDDPGQLASAHVSGLRAQIEAQVEACDPIAQAEVRLGLAAHRLHAGDLELALQQFEQAMALVQQPGPIDAEERRKRQQLIDINSWNFAIALLQHQQLERGWRLFEYGLRTPADGAQRWQRALHKPFSSGQLPLWRGESLVGRRLLVLEEQAVGDVMMFLTLLPALVEEAQSVGLVLGDRLLPIYRRSLPALGFGDRLQIWSQAEARSGAMEQSTYDLQTPLGSVCQYRFTSIGDYGRYLPLLRAKPQRVDQMRREYLQHGQPAERLIGISWLGGGKGVRVQQKSISPDQFAQLLQPIPGVRFVSLQYGNAAPTVQQWRQQGLDVVHDPRVNPLQQMDLWLAQVAACDAVLSVANTTIHGAGGLGLPTLCLLSLHSDWRWFNDPAVTRSYWYPTVGIARELKQGGWVDALAQARLWLEQGCPMPTGPVASAPGMVA